MNIELIEMNPDSENPMKFNDNVFCFVNKNKTDILKTWKNQHTISISISENNQMDQCIVLTKEAVTNLINRFQRFLEYNE